MKNNQLEGNYFQSTENQEFSIPAETLQTYYKDAYMRERERFNSMFGTLEFNPPYEQPIYDSKEKLAEETAITEDMVPKKKLKKAKRALGVFVFLTIVFLGAAAYFGAKVYGLL